MKINGEDLYAIKKNMKKFNRNGFIPFLIRSRFYGGTCAIVLIYDKIKDELGPTSIRLENCKLLKCMPCMKI